MGSISSRWALREGMKTDYVSHSPAVSQANHSGAGPAKGVDDACQPTVFVVDDDVSFLRSISRLLRTSGYHVVILEAARRAGGRSLTLRRGDVLKEMGDAPAQVCEFDEGLYLNAGPVRIPHHHVHVIDYCRQFGVALQPYIFASRANLVHTGAIGNGKTMQVRRALYDLQGHVAELLDKCSRKGDLDGAVSRLTPPVVREVSPTGSGDVLFAALLHAWCGRGLSLREAVSFALPYAAANAAHPGIAEFLEPVG